MIETEPPPTHTHTYLYIYIYREREKEIIAVHENDDASISEGVIQIRILKLCVLRI